MSDSQAQPPTLEGAVARFPFSPPDADIEFGRQFFAANDSVVAHLGAQFVLSLRDVPESFDGVIAGWAIPANSGSDAFLCTSVEPGEIYVYNGPTADVTIRFPLSQTNGKFIPIRFHADDPGHFRLVDNVSGFIVDCGDDAAMHFDGARALDRISLTIRGYYLWYSERDAGAVAH